MSECVYVISAGEFMQKIGIADDPRARMIAMQTGCPLRLSLVLALETPRALRVEQDVHRLFAADRLRGEWFEVGTIAAVQAVCAAALGMIETLKQPSPAALCDSALVEAEEDDGYL